MLSIQSRYFLAKELCVCICLYSFFFGLSLVLQGWQVDLNAGYIT